MGLKDNPTKPTTTTIKDILAIARRGNYDVDQFKISMSSFYEDVQLKNFLSLI